MPTSDCLFPPLLTPTPPNYLSNSLSQPKNIPSLLNIDPFKTTPQYFILKRTEDALTFNDASPFKIQSFIERDIGVPKQVNRLRDGSLLVQVSNDEMAKKVYNLKLLGSFPINVEIHKSLNSCKGVIYCKDLTNFDEKDILEELRKQNVTEVKCIMTRQEGVLKPSPLHILTFNSIELPHSVYIGFIRVSVRPHIPNPLRCLNCQQYGHIQTSCKKPHICPNCGKSKAHEDKPCDQEVHCLNCGGNHPAWSRECPAWKREKKVMEIKTKEKLSVAEARRRYHLLSPKPTLPKSFSEAAGTPLQTPVVTTAPSEIKNMLQLMMAQLLAGQKETQEKLEEQSKKIDEQTREIKKLREENEELKIRNTKMEQELQKLKPIPKPDQTKQKISSQPKVQPVGTAVTGSQESSQPKVQPVGTAVTGSQESLDSQNVGDCSMDCSGSEVVSAAKKGVKKQRITFENPPFPTPDSK
jgi:hypothetical protein